MKITFNAHAGISRFANVGDVKSWILKQEVMMTNGLVGSNKYLEDQY